ncbi:MAG: HlyD family efflux transporter periplasmic adaptor subunit [Pirellulaceae bacterium]|nr:HlyD family efflux transporter periplasmic adaptor subunit [Pirellulaceae bacterium]
MKLKLRSDLQFVPRSSSRGEAWIVKDPVAFSHFLFSRPEFQLAKFFDGKNSEEDILLLWRNQFKSDALTLDQVQQFAHRLIRDNLVTGNQLGFGSMLRSMRPDKRAARWMTLLSAPLVIRLRGFNPRFFLTRMAGLGWLLFHPAVIALNLLLAASLILFLLGHFEEVNQRLPAISQLLSKQGIVSLVITMAIIKIIHEFGHALACQRYGGECFEIGVILLALIPTLYCNVSDAWTLPERSKRIMISAAGIYFEVVLAALAALTWFCTTPGLMNAISFNVVLLCSVNTILINGNPLLRYDGYYILSDWFDRPNLAGEAKIAVWNFINGLFRQSLKPVAFNGWLLAFGIASTLYRWFILISIGTGIFLVTKSFGFPLAGYLMFVLIIVSSFLQILMQRKQMKSKHLWGGIHPVKFTVTSIALIVLLGVFFRMPMPSYVYCNAVAEAREPWVLYAPMDGKLESLHPPYQWVERGTELARIRNKKLEFRVQQKGLELQRLTEQTERMELQANDDPNLIATINVLKRNEEKVTSELRLLRLEAKKLTIHAPAHGMVYPAQQSSSTSEIRPAFLNWDGEMGESRIKGYLVPRGEALISLSDPNSLQITLFVGERDVNLITQGEEVLISFEQQPQQIYHGRLGEIFKEGVDVSENPALFDVGLETVIDGQGSVQTLQTPYRAEVIIEGLKNDIFPGSRGNAKIRVRSQTLAEKCGRFINRIIDTQL